MHTRLQALNPSAEIVSLGANGDYYDLLQIRELRGISENSARAGRIFALLHKHYLGQTTDPPHIRQDIELMANYFSRYSELQPLFTALEKMPWHWQYSSGKAETQVQGTRLQVHAANILFDSRAGARFQFQKACRNKIAHCFAAPADVFLHELLHVQTIFSQPQEFIAQGGMGLHLYPHLHEQHTITREQQLFRTMTQLDFIPRPRRSSHTGQRTITHCVTCLQ